MCPSCQSEDVTPA